MTDLKYSILEVLYNAPHRQENRIDIIKRKFAPPTSTNYAIDELIEDKLIKSMLGSDSVKLTSLGATVYEQANEERKKQAKQERQQRFENKVSVASVLVPLITFFLGIIVESQANIIDWLVALFK